MKLCIFVITLHVGVLFAQQGIYGNYQQGGVPIGQQGSIYNQPGVPAAVNIQQLPGAQPANNPVNVQQQGIPFGGQQAYYPGTQQGIPIGSQPNYNQQGIPNGVQQGNPYGIQGIPIGGVVGNVVQQTGYPAGSQQIGYPQGTQQIGYPQGTQQIGYPQGTQQQYAQVPQYGSAPGPISFPG